MNPSDRTYTLTRSLRVGVFSSRSIVKPLSILIICGIAHLVVDACCAALVFRIVSLDPISHPGFVGLLFIYHVFAFGLQSPLGLVFDAIKKPRLAAALGCILSALAMLFPSMPILAIIIAGLGNALFHIGGGIICVRITPHRATAPGIFVAPGSLGLLVGMVIGKIGATFIDPLFISALILSLLMACISEPNEECQLKSKNCATRGELVVGLILIVITARSFLGFVVIFPWETHASLLITLTIAIVLSKALGGILADKWGWTRVGVGSLLVSLPFLACVSQYPLAAIPGLFFLNITMPVTLAAVVEALPGHPGFAFGLTCLAILIGSFPLFINNTFYYPSLILLIILIATPILFKALRWLLVDYKVPINS